MAVRIDQAGQKCAPPDIDRPLDRHDRGLPIPEDLDDLSLVVDDQRPEPLQLTVAPHLDSASIVDEDVGERRRRQQHRDHGEKGFAHRRGIALFRRRGRSSDAAHVAGLQRFAAHR